MRIIIVFFVILIIISCSNQNIIDWKTIATKAISDVYYEDAHYAGFENGYTNKIDIFYTYSGLLTNKYLDTHRIDESKIKKFLIIKLNQRLLKGNLSKDLTEERYIIDSISMLGIKIDNKLKLEIYHNLNKYINDNIISIKGDKITEQYKTMIYYNYLRILFYIGFEPPLSIKSSIMIDLKKTEEDSDKEELSVIKALYYRYMIRKRLNMLSDEFVTSTINALKNLQTSEGGFRANPNESLSPNSDIFSTVMALEMISKFDDRLSLFNLNMVEEYLDNTKDKFDDIVMIGQFFLASELIKKIKE